MAEARQSDEHQREGVTPLRFRSSADTEGEVRRVLGKLEATGHDLPISRLLANAPAAFRPFVLLSDALLNRSILDPLVRETVILHLAARLGVRYEWGEHVPMSEDAGVTEQMRSALAAPASGDMSALTDQQRAAVRIADQILARTLTDAGWEEACSLWGAQGALELTMAVGFWGGFIPAVIGVVERQGLVARGRAATAARGEGRGPA
jgi:alkylhydroperoxidase family enzyme